VTLAIERGASISDITLLLECDRASARKLNSAFQARAQSRTLYAWTWRRADGSPLICAGMEPVAPGRLETWFTCKPDLTPGELHNFILFARLVLWCVWRERKPIEFVAWVKSPATPGGRMARLMGFTTDAKIGGEWRVVWNPEKEKPCPMR
jgi:hypothetical protein